MTVRPRGNKWQADFMVKGTRYRAEFETKEAAEAWELESRAKIMKGQAVERQAMARPGNGPGTIQALVEYCSEHHWRKKKSADYLIRNANLFCTFVGPKLAVKDALTRENIQAYVKQLEDRGRSDGTVNRHLSAISVLCKIGVEIGALDERPRGVQWHRQEAEGRIRYLDEREEAALLKTLKEWGQDDLWDFYCFLIDTGARLGEALKLEWREVRDNRYATFLGDGNDLEDGWPLFAAYCAGQPSPHVQRVYSFRWVRDPDGNRLFYRAEMERLAETVESRMEPGKGHCERDRNLMSAICRYWSRPAALAETFRDIGEEGAAAMLEDLASRFEAEKWDMHEANWMFRADGTLVLIDPFSNSRSNPDALEAVHLEEAAV